MPIDPQLKVLIEANSIALGALLTKIVSGDQNLTEEIARVSATDADLRSAIAEIPSAPESPLETAPAD